MAAVVSRRIVLAGIGATIAAPMISTRAASPATFYFDNDAGDDRASGRSPGDPLRSLARLNMMEPGSVCLLKNNSVWKIRESGILNPSAGMTVKPYGTGSSIPRLDGSVPIGPFAPIARSPNLWAAKLQNAGWYALLRDPVTDQIFWGLRVPGDTSTILRSLDQPGAYYVDIPGQRLIVMAKTRPKLLVASVASPLAMVQWSGIEIADLDVDMGVTGIRVVCGDARNDIESVSLRRIRATHQTISGIQVAAGVWNAPAGSPPCTVRDVAIIDATISLTGSSGIGAYCPGVQAGKPQGIGDYRGLVVRGGRIDQTCLNTSEPGDYTLGYGAGVKFFGATPDNTKLVIEGVTVSRAGAIGGPPGTGGMGIWIDTVVPGAATVIRNTCIGNRYSGIFIEESAGQVVRDNICRENGRTLTAITDVIRHGGLSLYRGTRDCIVEGNVLEDNGGAQLVCYAETTGGSPEWPDWQTTGNRIRGNRLRPAQGAVLVSLGTSGSFDDVRGNHFADNWIGPSAGHRFRGSQHNGGEVAQFTSLAEWEGRANLAHGAATQSIAAYPEGR